MSAVNQIHVCELSLQESQTLRARKEPTQTRTRKHSTPSSDRLVITTLRLPTRGFLGSDSHVSRPIGIDR